MRIVVPTILAAALSACAPANQPGMGATDARPPAAAPDAPVRSAARPGDPTSPAQAPAVQGPGETARDAAAPDAFDASTIPARFHGAFAAAGRCGAAGDESRLAVFPDRVEFHESVGRVLHAGGHGDRLRVRLSLAGEGDAREATYDFVREDEGRRIVDAASGYVRLRCDRTARG